MFCAKIGSVLRLWIISGATFPKRTTARNYWIEFLAFIRSATLTCTILFRIMELSVWVCVSVSAFAMSKSIKWKWDAFTQNEKCESHFMVASCTCFYIWPILLLNLSPMFIFLSIFRCMRALSLSISASLFIVHIGIYFRHTQYFVFDSLPTILSILFANTQEKRAHKNDVPRRKSIAKFMACSTIQFISIFSIDSQISLKAKISYWIFFLYLWKNPCERTTFKAGRDLHSEIC